MSGQLCRRKVRLYVQALGKRVETRTSGSLLFSNADIEGAKNGTGGTMLQSFYTSLRSENGHILVK